MGISSNLQLGGTILHKGRDMDRILENLDEFIKIKM